MAATQGRLIIICGLPGAGKTTLASTLARRPGATLFASDDWLEALDLGIWDEDRRRRIESLQWQLARDILALGGTAIVEWGSWRRADRDTLREGARELGAAVELHYLSAPLETLFERITRRGRENPPITFAMFEEWATHFQPPTPDEFALYDSASQVPS